MPNLKLTLSYDGTKYFGWQSQAGGRTLQDELWGALERLCGARPKLYAAGRTDSGVHARGQVVNFRHDGRMTPGDLLKALNALLPLDMAVLSAEIVPDDFHAQHGVVRKCYAYRLFLSPIRPVFERDFYHYYWGDFSEEKIRWGLSRLQGRHDFRGFSAKGDVLDTVREMERAELIREADGEGAWMRGNPESGARFRFEFVSSGFLYRQVRIMVGSLLLFARGKMSEADFLKCLEESDWKLQGDAAPAKGLCLEWVEYKK